MTSASIDAIREAGALIRSLSRDDLPQTLAWRNHPDSRSWFHSDAVISPEQHSAWYESYLTRDDDYMFIVEVDSVAVAQVSLYRIEGDQAEFGRLLVAPSRRAEGFGSLTTSLCLRVADDVLHLARTYLEVKATNDAAIAAYRRAGFTPVEDEVGTHGSLVMRRERP